MNGKTAKLIRKAVDYKNAKKISRPIIVSEEKKEKVVNKEGKTETKKKTVLRKLTIMDIDPNVREFYQRVKDKYKQQPRDIRATAKTAMREKIVEAS